MTFGLQNDEVRGEAEGGAESKIGREVQIVPNPNIKISNRLKVIFKKERAIIKVLCKMSYDKYLKQLIYYIITYF